MLREKVDGRDLGWSNACISDCLHWWERDGYLQQSGGWTISRIPFLPIKVASDVPVMDRIRFLCM